MKMTVQISLQLSVYKRLVYYITCHHFIEKMCICYSIIVLIVALKPLPSQTKTFEELYGFDMKKHTPERVEYMTESEMEESEFETARHNRTESVAGSSDEDSFDRLV